MKKRYCRFFTFFIILFFAQTVTINALAYTDFENSLTNIFAGLNSGNEGMTSYRSLLIPVGGRSESLGSAYTGLCDDAGYINFNGAASCLQKQTQLSFFHNSWIADSSMETITFTARPIDRLQNLGFGAQAQCFYVPFSEYNIYGERVNSTYYTETTAAINVSYNFLAGYEFKGLAIGGTIKSSFRGMPNYTDDNSDAIIKFSGIAQSGLSFMADLGIMMQFNFLKFYHSREPNVRIGFAAQNVGIGFTGVGSGKGIAIDDPLPTYFAGGMSVQFIPMLTVTADFKQPVNLFDPGAYQIFTFGAGAILDFEERLHVPLNLLVGAEFKGGNPRLSTGVEFGLNNTRLNFNYTLDFTSSLNPINKISLSAKVLLGDNGRAKIQKIIDELYTEGLEYYYHNQWQLAIDVWEQILQYNKRYDPALLGIQSAQAQLDMLQSVRDSMFFGD